jgi:O-antigen/teichoic acid export membrane protein
VTLLVYYPTSMVGRYLSGIHLPSVANSRQTPDAFRAARWRLASQFLLLGAAIVAGFTLLGPVFTPLFYGADFQQPLQIFALLALLQAMRFLRLWPTALAVGTGRSTIVMLNNVARMVGLPVAIVAAQISPSLEAIIVGIALGELLALLVALSLLARHDTVDLLQELRRVALFLAFGAGLVGLASSVGVAPPWSLAIWALMSAAAGGGLLYLERATIMATLQIARRKLDRLSRPKSF